jgi:predicted metal-dependent hydrolase
MTVKVDKIIRSKRTSFSIELKPDGRLIVRAPLRATESQIQALVVKKADWIRKTRRKLREKYPDLKPKTFHEGEMFWYLGKQYPLSFGHHKRPALIFEDTFLLSEAYRYRAKDVFIAWYRERTREIVRAYVQHYQGLYDFDVDCITITRARTRWGSCSSRANLNFTYRLSMAPPSVIEYVVVHELVHLKIRNHSKAFWAKVAAIRPDYQADRRWLKDNGAWLTLD